MMVRIQRESVCVCVGEIESEREVYNNAISEKMYNVHRTIKAIASERKGEENQTCEHGKTSLRQVQDIFKYFKLDAAIQM